MTNSLHFDRKPDFTFAGIPVYVSPLCEKGKMYCIPDPYNDTRKMIVTDALQTVEARLDRLLDAMEYRKRCSMITNIGETKP